MKRLAFVVSMCVAMSGCAWGWTEPLPPRHEPGDAPLCTTERKWSVIDGVLGTLSAITAGAALTDEEFSSSERAGAGATLGVLALVLYASTYYGIHQTARCREARADYVRRSPR